MLPFATLSTVTVESNFLRSTLTLGWRTLGRVVDP